MSMANSMHMFSWGQYLQFTMMKNKLLECEMQKNNTPQTESSNNTMNQMKMTGKYRNVLKGMKQKTKWKQRTKWGFIPKEKSNNKHNKSM